MQVSSNAMQVRGNVTQVRVMPCSSGGYAMQVGVMSCRLEIMSYRSLICHAGQVLGHRIQEYVGSQNPGICRAGQW